jgi:hypothetical protein
MPIVANGAGEEDIHVQQARAEWLGWDCGMWNHIFPLLNLCRRIERCIERECRKADA